MFEGWSPSQLQWLHEPVPALSFPCRGARDIGEQLAALEEHGDYEYGLEPAPGGLIWISDESLAEVVELRCADGADVLEVFARRVG